MGKNIVKAFALCIIIIVSLRVSAFCINEHVIEVKAREKTIADAIIKQQMQEGLKEAQEKIEAAKKEENIIVATEKVEMKPPIVEENKDKINTDEQAKADTNNSVENSTNNNGTDIDNNENDECKDSTSFENDFSKEVDDMFNGEAEKIVIPQLGEYTVLDDKAIEEIKTHLIEKYLLNGYIYVEMETDTNLKARKQLACNMENYVINCYASISGIVPELKSFNFSSVKKVKKEVEDNSIKFREEFIRVGDNGEEFSAIYDNVNEFFDKSIEALQKLEDIFNAINNSPNRLLAFGAAVNSIDREIMPAIKDIISCGCDLKEKTNLIYLEGVEGVTLLTREEATEIINILMKAELSGGL